MLPFAGYEMPISYDSYSGGMIQEHLKVRQSVGIFDVSHMGEFLIEGPDAISFLTYMTTRDFSTSKDGKAYYCLLLQEAGGIVDDILVYRFNSESFWLVVNASNIEKDWKHLLAHTPNFKIKMTDLSSDLALIAIQGPKAVDLVNSIFPGASELRYYSFKSFDSGHILSRTGYTGEDGFEVFVPASGALELWKKFLDLQVSPIGLGARDTLRLEAGFPLYGQELREDLLPQESLSAFAVRNSTSFLGSSACKKPPRWKPVALLGETPKPMRSGEKIFFQGRQVGELTSGSTSPILRKGIGLGLIEASCPLEFQSIFMLESAGKQREAKLVLLPFVESMRVKKKSES